MADPNSSLRETFHGAARRQIQLCELAESGLTLSQRLVLKALVGILYTAMGREALHRSNWGAILRALSEVKKFPFFFHFKLWFNSVNIYGKSASYVAH